MRRTIDAIELLSLQLCGDNLVLRTARIEHGARDQIDRIGCAGYALVEYIEFRVVDAAVVERDQGRLPVRCRVRACCEYSHGHGCGSAQRAARSRLLAHASSSVFT